MSDLTGRLAEALEVCDAATFLLDPTPALPISMTEAEMTRLLDQRYTKIRPGTTADRYVRAAQVINTQSLYSRYLRICDYLAIDKYSSAPQAIHGHEIKVSRSDWLTELREPEKADAWRRWCNYWWLVVPDPAIVKPGELPEGWGLMVPTSGGVLRARKKPDYANVPDLPLDVVAGIAYAAQKHERTKGGVTGWPRDRADQIEEDQ